jgi:hypothetical protein
VVLAALVVDLVLELAAPVRVALEVMAEQM